MIDMEHKHLAEADRHIALRIRQRVTRATRTKLGY
jgi:hypothetical protein